MSTSFAVNAKEKTTLHIHVAMVVSLWLALHQLHSKIFVNQFMHNALTMHKVVDEQELYHWYKEVVLPVNSNSLIT